MVKRRNHGISLALECALLFLAITVFGWGLRGKLALYHADIANSSTVSTTAKLTIEERSARSLVAAHAHVKPRLTPDSMCRVAFAFALLIPEAPLANRVQDQPGPSTPGLYNLHGPVLMRRPPPTLS